MKLKIGLVFLSLFLIAICPLIAQDWDDIVTGKVVAIDSLGRKLTIRHSNVRTGRSDQVTFRVPKEAELTRGTKSMSFLDINLSDMVTVTYYSDDHSGLKVRRLENLNLGNR
jgi:hypothetical protein